MRSSRFRNQRVRELFPFAPGHETTCPLASRGSPVLYQSNPAGAFRKHTASYRPDLLCYYDFGKCCRPRTLFGTKRLKQKLGSFGSSTRRVSDRRLPGELTVDFCHPDLTLSAPPRKLDILRNRRVGDVCVNEYRVPLQEWC